MPAKSAAPILAALMSLSADPAARGEDLTLVFKVTDRGGERAATHHFTATKARFDDGDRVTIVDFATGEVWSLAMKKKQYSETTFREIEQAMSSTSAQMEKAMAGIPEGLRDRMTGEAAREVTITVGETRTVAGVLCQNHIVKLGDKMRMEACATTLMKPPFDPGNFRNLALATAPIGPGSSGINKMVEKLRSIEGIVLASSVSVTMLGKMIDTVTEATEIRQGPVDPGLFKIPQGFKKVDSPWH